MDSALRAVVDVMPLVRLQKFLADAGVCSRRRGEDLIRAGRVRVNGQVVTVLGAKIDSENDQVTVDSQQVRPQQSLVYIALHKPRGYVTSCRHSGKKIVLELVNVRERIYPVGRLDKDSTGLLILTNDGRLHLKLSHPSFDHEKEYEVVVERPISDGALRRMTAGMPILNTRTRPAVVTRIGERAFRIVLKEGRNRQIRRMVRRLGNEVLALKRIRVAAVRLGRLAEGAWRHLTAEEVAQLLDDPASRTQAGVLPVEGGMSMGRSTC
jgi:23S rRNA pseudouridine2605 synthase/23S rRNA pseudouridine2604 synthase